MIETTHTFQVEYAPATYITTKATKKTPKMATFAGYVTLSDSGASIIAPRHVYDISYGSSAVVVKPEHLDSLIAALQEARVIGRHLYGKKEAA